MSWIQRLSETYDNCQEFIGVETEDKRVPPVTCLPYHTNGSCGNCHRREWFLSEERISFQRRTPELSFPVLKNRSEEQRMKLRIRCVDKLQYTAGDFRRYIKSKDSYFKSYQNLLTQWCFSKDSNPKINAISEYINKESLIDDLINNQILYPGDDVFFFWKRKKGDKIADLPAIFKVVQSQQDVFYSVE